MLLPITYKLAVPKEEALKKCRKPLQKKLVKKFSEGNLTLKEAFEFVNKYKRVEEVSSSLPSIL